jgi:hypothetical protein
MTNIRGKKVTILRNTWYYAELVLVFLAGLVSGMGGMKLYYMIDNYINAEPIEYLCRNNVVYEQANPISTVYIKTNQECVGV